MSDDLTLPPPSGLVRDFRETVVPSDPAGDYDAARRNVHEMLTRNADALEAMTDLASQAPHPRVFEVMGQLVKAGLDASQALMDIAAKEQNLRRLRSDEPQVVNQTLVVTSSEILDQLKTGISEGKKS